MSRVRLVTSHFEQAGVSKPRFIVPVVGTHYYVMQ